uniref:Serotonin 5HT-2 receptor n=1 Tax=Rattus norvegicus TaxID=10116 RepID=Q63005_RAT|nr:serotonin 5HT-2 receptor [Rattus norvegicus]
MRFLKSAKPEIKLLSSYAAGSLKRGDSTLHRSSRQASHRIADPGDNECKFLGCCLLLLWDFLSA